MNPQITHIDPEETIRKLKAKVARLEKANQAMLEALKLAVTLVHCDVILVRENQRVKLIDALEQWNEAIAKGEAK